MSPSTWEEIKERVARVGEVAREVLYGMTVYEWVRGCEKSRGELEKLFVLIVFGDLLGVPILPPYYSLELLPYAVPMMNRWKRSMLRERDWTDLNDLIEGIG